MAFATKICEHVLAVSCLTLLCQYVARFVCWMCLSESLNLLRCDQVLHELTRTLMSHFSRLGWTARMNSQNWRRRKMSGLAARSVCEIVVAVQCWTSFWWRLCELWLREWFRSVFSHFSSAGFDSQDYLALSYETGLRVDIYANELAESSRIALWNLICYLVLSS